MKQEIVVEPRFNGPPGSGNGGYVCGLVGSHIDGPAEVTLRVPPPLGRPLTLTREGERLLLSDGDTLVAEAVPTTVDERPPGTVTPEEAKRATRGYRGFESHAFPTCFVCGTQRVEGDGLRIFAGPAERTGMVAAPWVPAADLADDGTVRQEIVWASLDCPSYFGGTAGSHAVLGRLAVDIRAAVVPGEPHVVVGWGRGSEGRKHYAASAVTTAGGEVVAVARATWIEPRQRFPSEASGA